MEYIHFQVCFNYVAVNTLLGENASAVGWFINLMSVLTRLDRINSTKVVLRPFSGMTCNC